MVSPLETTFAKPANSITALFLVGLVSWIIHRVVINLYFHPLSRFPGPKLAAITTLWKAFLECVLLKSFCHVLEGLHAKYGEVVRVGPNELHFSNPRAYHEIYNNRNRWDKEYKLYHSFGEDRSSFGFLTYKESKERKDVLNKLFSQRAIEQVHGLVLEKVDALCDAFTSVTRQGKVANLSWAFRCMTLEVITYLCFGKSCGAIEEKDFKAPIIIAMDASTPIFVRFKHSELYKNMIMNCPPNISKIVSPATAGLVDLQQILSKQIAEIANNPDNLKNLPHNMTIYHHLITPEAYKNGTIPEPGSLYEETQALMFGGGDTAGNTLMLGSFYLLKNPETYATFKSELKEAWPNLDQPPSIQQLERMPYLNAVIKESLRMSSGVVSGLLRVVPQNGVQICGQSVPGGTIVSCGSTFVHYNHDIFPQPHVFRPERWLQDPSLDNWLVSFSRGPRSCLGINLAWVELRLTFSYVFRRFDMELDPSSPEELSFKEAFLPMFCSGPVLAKFKPVTE